jgi:hypothetical protein
LRLANGFRLCAIEQGAQLADLCVEMLPLGFEALDGGIDDLGS